MTIRTTRWSSDICACVIEYTWDDTLPENKRTPKLKKFIHKCAAHSKQRNDDLSFNAALTDNQLKNSNTSKGQHG